jgi:UDP-glucose 4-epimerase
MTIAHSFVAGGAGFIGANLVSVLLARGRRVTVVDNMSRGRADYLPTHKNLRLVKADLADRAQAMAEFSDALGRQPINEVWHLAANSDIPAGVADVDVDFKDTFQTSLEIVRAMQKLGIPRLHFASSSAIYGDLGDTELHEEIGPLLPISNYGAMKLASEAIASAATEASLEQVNIFRFPNVVGTPATHGVLLDFVRKLQATPDQLDVLGDGTQQKAYLHVSDLVDAMLTVVDRTGGPKVLPINIGPVDAGVTVRWIAEQVVARVSPAARMAFGTGGRGWVGDVPRFRYSTARLQAMGWAPKLGSAAAIARAIDEIARQEGA